MIRIRESHTSRKVYRRCSRTRFVVETLEERALLSFLNPPVAQFTWSMPQRFGLDQQTIHYNPATGVTTLTPGPDGVIDYNYSQSYVNPTSWELDLNGSSSKPGKTGLFQSPIVDYTFVVDGKAYDSGRSPTLAIQLPSQGAHPALGAHTVTEIDTAANGLKATTTQQVVMKDYVIVSLGDSYASGEGIPDKPIVYNAAGQVVSGPVWENARAQLSSYAGEAQMALAIERADPHSSVTFLSFASAGAGLAVGLLGPYDGEVPPTNVPHSPLPSQLDQILQTLYPHGTSPGAHPRPIDALTIMIGGNDIHFSTLVEAALDPLLPPIYNQPAIVGQLGSDLNALPGLYNQLGAAIRTDLPGLVKNVYLTEYPDPTHNAFGGFSNGTGLFFGLTAAEAKWAYENAYVPLDNAERQAAVRNGWVLVGGIASASLDHGVTAGSGPNGSWFVTLGESLIDQGDINGTVHPNKQGQALIRNALLVSLLTHGFTTGGQTS